MTTRKQKTGRMLGALLIMATFVAVAPAQAGGTYGDYAEYQWAVLGSGASAYCAPPGQISVGVICLDIRDMDEIDPYLRGTVQIYGASGDWDATWSCSLTGSGTPLTDSVVGYFTIRHPGCDTLYIKPALVGSGGLNVLMQGWVGPDIDG